MTHKDRIKHLTIGPAHRYYEGQADKRNGKPARTGLAGRDAAAYTYGYTGRERA